MSKPLPESIKQKIDYEAEVYGEQAGERLYNVHEVYTHAFFQNGYAVGATEWATKYLAEKERADQLEAILEDKLTGPEGNKTAASDAYYELARMLLGGLPGSAIEALSALQDEVHQLRARAVKAERDAQTAEQENETLKRWKAEATEVMAPIYDWFHKQKDIPLGSRMTVVILERLEAYEKEKERADMFSDGNNKLLGARDLALKALNLEKERADRLEKALEEIQSNFPASEDQAIPWARNVVKIARSVLPAEKYGWKSIHTRQ